jgi:cell cycle checkpoint protein
LIEIIIDSANGDVRSAINTLQVLCLSDDAALLQQERGTKRKADGKPTKKKAKKARRAMSAISGREASLVLFHTLGKILYNKRVGDPSEEGDSDSDFEGEDVKGQAQGKDVSLPLHLASQMRRKSKVDVEVSLMNVFRIALKET